MIHHITKDSAMQMPTIFGASASRQAATVTSATPEPPAPYLSRTTIVVPDCEQKSLQCEDTPGTRPQSLIGLGSPSSVTTLLCGSSSGLL